MKIADPISSVLRNKSSRLWRITPQEMVFDAIRLMSEKNVGALLVMDGDHLLGIVSERDYTRKVILKGRSSKETAVAEIMTRDLETASPSSTVEECLQLMTRRRIRHLPVCLGDEVIGILSIGDLVKWTISAQNAMIDQLESYIHGAYPV